MTHGSVASAGVSHDELRRQTVEDLDALIQAAIDMRRDLRSYQAAVEENRENLAHGGRGTDMTRDFDVASLRSTFVDRVDNIERTRNNARCSVWRLQLVEGMTIAEIARAWGLSRQLVSRALGPGTAARLTGEGRS